MFSFSKKKKELNIAEILNKRLVCQKCGKSFLLEKFQPFTLSKCPYCQDYNFIPNIVRRYCIFKPLGGGGAGCVYKAYDLEQDRYVAIKTLRGIKEQSNEALVSEFLKEYAIGKKVSTHPNFCKTYDFFEMNGCSYIVLEFVSGDRLDKIITPDSLPDIKLVSIWGLQILSALQHMYKFDYLYRDLKPQNILITEKEKNVKIIDFGLSCKKEETGMKTGVIVGSPEFNITPERSKFAMEDMYSEVYGLGMLMYFCLTGKTFYKASTVQELVNLHNISLRVSDLSKKMAHIHPRMAAVIGTMIKNNHYERFQTYKEAYQALEAIEI